MPITLWNLIVNVIAALIRDKYRRQSFRNIYKKKTKFRKLRDDNFRLLHENKIIHNEISSLREELSQFKSAFSNYRWEWGRINSMAFISSPINNLYQHGPNSDVFLAIVCAAKNEGPYLKEWIEYHKLVGVERFYFYDNLSEDNTKEVLDPYIIDGTVVYHKLPNHPITNIFPQIEAYNDAIYKYRDRTRWMAIIDVDEFIVPVEKDSIQDFLADYDPYPAVVANWVCFDSNGHLEKPTAHGGLVTANYTRVRKDHNHRLDRTIKSIVNPKLVINYISEHNGLYYHNLSGVSENFKPVRGIFSNVHSSDKIRINHYSIKSREEYIKKISRNRRGFPLAYKFKEEALNFKGETLDDMVIQKFVQRLKQVLVINE